MQKLVWKSPCISLSEMMLGPNQNQNQIELFLQNFFLAMLSFDKLFAKLFCQLIVNRVAIICPFKCADMGRHGLSHTLTSVSRFDTVSQVLF